MLDKAVAILLADSGTNCSKKSVNGIRAYVHGKCTVEELTEVDKYLSGLSDEEFELLAIGERGDIENTFDKHAPGFVVTDKVLEIVFNGICAL